jgi:hypothetical protein
LQQNFTMINEQQIRQFFIAYESRFNASLTGTVDVEGTIQAFSDSFIEASPVGIQCGKNDARFKEMIPKGYEFYRSIGTTAMKITSMDITGLDDFHAMIKVFWQAFYNKKVTIDFTVIYFVQVLNNQIKIFAYITGDEQKVLRERGLVPDNQ